MNEKVTSIPELFGSMVFTQEQMRQRLPARVYNAWQQCLALTAGGRPDILSISAWKEGWLCGMR